MKSMIDATRMIPTTIPQTRAHQRSHCDIAANSRPRRTKNPSIAQNDQNDTEPDRNRGNQPHQLLHIDHVKNLTFNEKAHLAARCVDNHIESLGIVCEVFLDLISGAVKFFDRQDPFGQVPRFATSCRCRASQNR